MALKIYFCGSILAGRDDAGLYNKLITHLQTHGTVLTAHVGRMDVIDAESHLFEGLGEEAMAKRIHDRDVEWLEEADVLIAEVSQQSLGVGYEIGRAVIMRKPVLCMFRPSSGNQLSCMIQGLHTGSNIAIKHYEESEAFTIMDDFINNLQKMKEAEYIAPFVPKADNASDSKAKSLKIFFAGSIGGGKDDFPLYSRLIRHLGTHGTVLTEVNQDYSTMPSLDEVDYKTLLYQQDTNWLRSADVMVAEVTQPSTGVGYEIGTAVAWGKQILCIFRPSSGRKLSRMIHGAKNEQNIKVVFYDEAEAFTVLDQFLHAHKTS